MKTRSLTFGKILPFILMSQISGLSSPNMFMCGGAAQTASSGRGFNDQAIFIPKHTKLKGYQR